MNLYEIESAIMGCWDEETGEIFDVEKMDKLVMMQEQKIENIACYIKNLDAEAEALKKEKLVFAERQRVAENKREALKKYLSGFLAGGAFKSTKASVSFRKSESVKILNMKEIPEQYLKLAEPTVDKVALKKAIKSGEDISGAELVVTQNIQIK